MPKDKDNRRYVTISVTDEQCERLRAYAERNGLVTAGKPSAGLAAKRLALSALDGEGTLDAALPYIDAIAERVEQRVTMVCSRGTRASLATLILLSLQKDHAPAAALDALNAEETYKAAWNMAGLTLKQDARKPSLYRTVSPALSKLYRSEQGKDALLDYMEEMDSTKVIYALDEGDISEWLKAMINYRLTADSVANRPRSMEERDIRAREIRRVARSTLLRILAEMGIETLEDTWHFQDGSAYSRDEGWHTPDAREDVYRSTRIHGEYAGRDTRDPNWREA